MPILEAPVFAPVSAFTGIDMSFIGSFIANDMGGAALADSVCEDALLGSFHGLVVASMLGATISFTIPVSISSINKEFHKDVFLGLLCGISTIPFGCFVSGLFMGINILTLVLNLVPSIFFSVIIVSLIVSMISSFSLEHEKQTYIICLVIVGVFLSIIIFTQLKPIKRLISKLIQGFVKHFINVASKDNVITIVENFGSYSIVEIYIHKMPNFLKNKTIHESKIKVTHDINILSIKRNKRQIEITRNTLVQENDVILVYGQYNKIKELFSNVHNKEEQIEEKNERFNEIDLIDNYSSQAMVEVKINEVPLVLSEKTLFNSGIKERFGINIIFIKRNEEIIEVDKDTIILKGDKIVLFGPYLAIKNVFLY